MPAGRKQAPLPPPRHRRLAISTSRQGSSRVGSAHGRRRTPVRARRRLATTGTPTRLGWGGVRTWPSADSLDGRETSALRRAIRHPRLRFLLMARPRHPPFRNACGVVAARLGSAARHSFGGRCRQLLPMRPWFGLRRSSRPRLPRRLTRDTHNLLTTGVCPADACDANKLQALAQPLGSVNWRLPRRRL